MTTNYKYPGETIAFTATKNYASGALVIIGTVAGVALRDIAQNEVGDAKVTGVFELDAINTATAAQGAAAYATSAGKVTGDAASNTRIGTFWRKKKNGETTALVKLAG